MARFNFYVSVRLACITLLIFTSAVALIGCYDESGEPEPDYSEGLVGPDQNGNGVRDDVDAYIQDNYSGDLRSALMQFAEPLTGLLLEAQNKEEAISKLQEVNAGIDCTHAVSPDEASEAITKVKAQILSTEERSQVYAEANSHAGGETFMLPPPGERIEQCEF